MIPVNPFFTVLSYYPNYGSLIYAHITKPITVPIPLPITVPLIFQLFPVFNSGIIAFTRILPPAIENQAG